MTVTYQITLTAEQAELIAAGVFASADDVALAVAASLGHASVCVPMASDHSVYLFVIIRISISFLL